MPLITQGKANVKYLLIVGLVAAVAGGIIFTARNSYYKDIVNLDNFSETKKSEKSIKNEIAGWKTYKNEYYGYEIKYPKELTATSSWETAKVVGLYKDINCINKSEFCGSIWIYVYENPKNLPLDKWCAETKQQTVCSSDYSGYILDNYDEENFKVRRMNINNLEVIFSSSNYPDEINQDSYTFSQNGLVCEIITFSHSYDETIEKMLSTFKFIGTSTDEIVGGNTSIVKTEEKISGNGLKAIIESSDDNQYHLVLVENGKEKIVDSCLIFNNTLKGEDLGKFCSYYDLSFSPQENYLIYSKEGYEWYGVFLYNIKTGEKRDFPDAHIAGLTGDEKHLFVCADNAFGGTYYGKVYNNKSLEEIYSVPEEYSRGIENCGYNSSKNIIFFDSTDEFKPTGDMIEYNLETYKANITNYKNN